MKASRGAVERERERSALLAGRMDAVVRWYRRRGTVYADLYPVQGYTLFRLVDKRGKREARPTVSFIIAGAH